MLELLNNICLFITDPILNWLLRFPTDVIIFAVAITTSAIITFSRKGVTNQDWLRRAEEDCVRQDQLAKEAKRRKDKDAARQHTMNAGMIRMRGLKYEGIPLLISILPIALLATWCFNRLGFVPPKEGDVVQIKMYFPRAAMGSMVHLVPQDGVEVRNGYVQKVGEDMMLVPRTRWDRGVAKIAEWFGTGFEFLVVKVFHGAVAPPPLMGGLAVWEVNANASPEPYKLQFVYTGKVHTKEFLVGRRIYSTQADVYDLDAPVQAIEQVLEPVRLFGCVGGLEFLGAIGLFFPAWLVAYLVICIPFVPLLKKVFHIY